MNNAIKELKGIYTKGYTIIPHVVEDDRSLSDGAKKLYKEFCRIIGGKNNRSFTMVLSRLLKYVKCCKSTFYKRLKELRESGYVVAERGGTCQPTKYTLVLDGGTDNVPCTKPCYTTEQPHKKEKELNAKENNNKHNYKHTTVVSNDLWNYILEVGFKVKGKKLRAWVRKVGEEKVKQYIAYTMRQKRVFNRVVYVNSLVKNNADVSTPTTTPSPTPANLWEPQTKGVPETFKLFTDILTH